MTPAFIDFVRVVIEGNLDQLSSRLAARPELATMSSDTGATRRDASTFFFTEIAHYLYAGDTALHMAAAAFRRPVAELLIANGADCRARNRRKAEPLHYAADTNRWNPDAQAETIEYLLSAGADPAAAECGGATPLHRAVRTRSLPAVRALLDGGADPGSETTQDRRRCILPFKPPGEVEAVLPRRANSRPASSNCCWSAVPSRPIGTETAHKCDTRQPATGFANCSNLPRCHD